MMGKAKLPEVIQKRADELRELARLREECERLRGALRDAEWVQHDCGGTSVREECPSCEQSKDYGHASDCELAAALKEPPCP